MAKLDPASLDHFIRQYGFKGMPPSKAGEPATDFVTCPVRMVFAYLDKPRENNFQKGKFEYEACFIVPPGVADLSIPKMTYVGVADRRFGAGQWQNLPKFNTFVKQQAAVNKEDPPKYPAFGKTGVFFKASSKFPVPVFDHNKMQLSVDPGRGVYSGMWCLAWLHLYAYPKPGEPLANPGVGARLVSIQKLADDEELRSQDKSDAFGVVAHQGGSAGAPAAVNSGPAQAPTAIPGF